MSFEKIAKEVVVNSIRSAICIDDSYASAYTDPGIKNLKYDEPKELYDSFRKIGKCDLDIYRFENLENSWNKEYMLANKDLMILDWELDQIKEPKYADTISILNDVIESDQIPFVVIYTNTDDIHQVGKTLIRKFNYLDQVLNKKTIVKGINKSLQFICQADEEIDFDFFLDDEDSIELLYNYIQNSPNNIEIKDELMIKLREHLPIKDGIGDDAICRLIYRQTADLINDKTDWIFSLAILGLIEEDDQNLTTYNLKRIDSKNLLFKINGTTILVYNKANDKEGVKPEDLFEVFSQAIVSNPHNYLSLLSLELKDQLREEFSKIGTRFSEIDESAFFYHMQNFREKVGQPFNQSNIYDFVIKSWMQDLNTHKLDGKSKVVSLIEEAFERVEDRIPTELDARTQESLTKYSALISSSTLKRGDRKLKFGDIFRKGNSHDYFICITPHCDCVNPADKINNNFYFIKGSVCSKEEAIKGAETGFFSFLNINNKAFCIKWSCKPFTAYINNNDIDNLEFVFKNETLQFEWITTLKDNFTQRLSNESFGYGYRVGIDLPHEVSPN